MNIDYKIPFYSNTPDNVHCFQSCLKMILKYFLPKEEYSYKQLEEETGFVEGWGTMPLKGMLWMQSLGFDVKDIEIFDYQKFIIDGGRYLVEFYGDKIAKNTIEHIDVDSEIQNSKKLLKSGSVVFELPTIEMMQSLLIDKYILICLIDNDKEGHFVVVKGIDGNRVIVKILDCQEKRMKR